MSTAAHGKRTRLGLLAAVAATWSLSFAAIHVAWASGSRRLLVDASAADQAFDQVWFRVYNLGVVFGCLLLAASAYAATRCDRPTAGRMGTWLSALGGVSLALRGAIGGVQLAWLELAGQRQAPVATWWVDGYMLLGGLVLLLLAANSANRRRPSEAASDRRPSARTAVATSRPGARGISIRMRRPGGA